MHPPLHLMVAAYLGIKPVKKEKPHIPTEDDLMRFVAQFGRA